MSCIHTIYAGAYARARNSCSARVQTSRQASKRVQLRDCTRRHWRTQDPRIPIIIKTFTIISIIATATYYCCYSSL